MRNLENGLFLLFLMVLSSCKKGNPLDLEKRLVGHWQIINSKSHRPNMVIYPMRGGGLFVYDSLSKRRNGWRSYSAWLSDTRDTLIGRQGCTQHYALRIAYLADLDRIVIDDTITMRHTRLRPE